MFNETLREKPDMYSVFTNQCIQIWYTFFFWDDDSIVSGDSQVKTATWKPSLFFPYCSAANLSFLHPNVLYLKIVVPFKVDGLLFALRDLKKSFSKPSCFARQGKICQILVSFYPETKHNVLLKFTSDIASLALIFAPRKYIKCF